MTDALSTVLIDLAQFAHRPFGIGSGELGSHLSVVHLTRLERCASSAMQDAPLFQGAVARAATLAMQEGLSADDALLLMQLQGFLGDVISGLCHVYQDARYFREQAAAG